MNGNQKTQARKKRAVQNMKTENETLKQQIKILQEKNKKVSKRK